MEGIEILKFQDDSSKRVVEDISEEIPLTIEVNGRELATLLCSPDHLKNLVTGFLFTSGVIPDYTALKSIIIDTERFNVSVAIEGDGSEFVFKRVYTSGCGKGVIFHNPMDVIHKTRLEDGFVLKATEISALMKEFIKGSPEHTRTRGVHSGALATRERILIFRDDIGRHNALDKVIGEALSQGLGFHRDDHAHHGQDLFGDTLQGPEVPHTYHSGPGLTHEPGGEARPGGESHPCRSCEGIEDGCVQRGGAITLKIN